MAKAHQSQSKNKAAKPKSGVMQKLASIFGGKKSLSTRAKKTKRHDEHDEQDANFASPAHSYKHKKMNLKKEFKDGNSTKTLKQDQSAANNMPRSESVRRHESPQRQIISGASINKKGRLF